MKKIQFLRNDTVYTPSNSGTALQTAKNAIMSLEDISDGEIVLARYQESNTEDIRTLLCIYYDGSTESGWTFIGGLRAEIEETEEAIAQALSDLNERVVENTTAIDSMSDLSTRMTQAESDIADINEIIEENEEITAGALSDLDARLDDEASARESLEQVVEDNELVTARALNELADRLDDTGTITGIKMNNIIQGTEGVVDLGTVLTRQSLTNYYTKSEVDAKNLDKVPYTNVSQASSAITIEPYRMYDFGTLADSHTVTFDTTKEVGGYVKEYMLRFVAGTSCNITLPNGVLYANGLTPTYVTGHTYEIDVMNNCAAVVEFY